MEGAPRAPEGAFRAIAVLIAVASVLLAAQALARYHTFHNRTFDLALYARVAWGLAHGEMWEPIVGGNFAGGHRPIVLLPLGMLGYAFDTAQVLLCAQAIALAAAAWPIARFARRRLGSFGAVCAAGAWLLHPNLGHVATYEFHPGNLAVLPLCLALDSLDRGATRGVLGYGLLAMACRSALALEAAAIAATGLLWRWDGARAPLWWLAAIALGYLALGTLWLTPAFGGDAPAGSLDLHFAPWGGSPLGVVGVLWRDPGVVLSHFAAPDRLLYSLRVLAPLGLLPLLGVRFWLPALPALALNLLSVFPTTTELYSHYLTPALPALFFAAIEGAHVCVRLWTRVWSSAAPPRLAVPRLLSGWLLLSAAAGSLAWGGLPWSRAHAAADFRADARTRELRDVLAVLPDGASVQAPDPLLPHLAERRAVHRAPPPERQTRFVVLDLSHRLRFAGREDLLRATEEPVARRWLSRSDHGLVHASSRYAVLERGRRPRAGRARRHFRGRISPDAGTPLCACLAVGEARLRRDRVLELGLIARAPCPSDLALRLGAGPRPARVDLLFEGLLSPAHLAAGDHLRSLHPLSMREIAAIERRGLYVGALRESGARPEPRDPTVLRIPVRHAP